MKNIFKKLFAITVIAGGLFTQQATALDYRFESASTTSWALATNWKNSVQPVSEEGGNPDHFIRIISPINFDVGSTFIWDGRLLLEGSLTINANELHIRQADYAGGDTKNMVGRLSDNALNIGGTGILRFTSSNNQLPSEGKLTTTISSSGQLIFENCPWTVGDRNNYSGIVTLKDSGKLLLLGTASLMKKGSTTDEINTTGEVESNKYVTFDTTTPNTAVIQIARKNKSICDFLVEWGFIRINNNIVTRANFDSEFTFDASTGSLSIFKEDGVKEIISINFGATVVELSGTELVGVEGVSADQWVNCAPTGDSGSDPITPITLPLNDQTGNTDKYSTMTVALSSRSGTWKSGGTANETEKMFYGYLDDNANNSTGVKMTDIPFDEYTVVLYFNTDSNNIGWHAMNVNGKDYTMANATDEIATEYTATIDNTAIWGNSSDSRGSIDVGVNTMVITGLTGSDLLIRSSFAVAGISSPGNNVARTCLSGFQLIHSEATHKNEIVFDGTSGSGSIINADPLNFNYNNKTKSMSISSWVKRSSDTSAGTICRRMNSNKGFYIETDAAGLVSARFDGNWGNATITSGATTLDDNWHHITFVLTGQNIYLFIDGVQVSTENDGGFDDGYSTTDPLYIGATNSTTGFFDGALADFRIYMDNGVGNSTVLATDISSIMFDDGHTYVPNNMELKLNLLFNNNLINSSGTVGNGTLTGSANYGDTFAYPATAKDDNISTTKNTPVTIMVKADNGHGIDHDPNNEPVALGDISSLVGTLTTIDLATGEFLYTPDTDTEGTTTFTYTLGASQATVSITYGDYVTTPWPTNRMRIEKVISNNAPLVPSNIDYNASTDGAGYPWLEDQTARVVEVNPNTPFDLDVTVRDHGAGSGYVWGGMALWIDWNNDGVFDTNTATEQYNGDTPAGTGGTGNLQVHKFSITPPSDAVLGMTRMRIITSEGEMNPHGGPSASGRGVDFGVNIALQTASLAIDDSGYSTFPGQLLTITDGPTDLLANDLLLPDTDIVEAKTGVTTEGGTYAVTADGGFTYTSKADFFGSDTFTYKLVPNGGGAVISSATVTIDVKGLLLHYKFDESDASITDVVDEVLGDVTTTGTADLAQWVAGGKFENALRLNGNNVTLPVDQFNKLNTAITLSYWFKGDLLNTGNVRLIQGLNSTGGEGREINIWMTHSDRVYMQAGAANTSSFDGMDKPSGGVENDDKWHHWVFTKDATKGEMIIYLDNVSWATATGKHLTFGDFVSVVLGNTADDGGMKGLIDNLKLFNYALSAAEVAALDPENEAIDDQYTMLAHEELSANVKDNDINADAIDVSLISDVSKGVLVFNGDGTFTYTPTSDQNSTTDSFVYDLAGTQATVTITVKGKVFHYKLDEEPGQSVVVDSTGRCPNSDTLDPSIILKGATGGSDSIPPDSSLNKTAEITENKKGIKISNLNLNITSGITIIGWIRPKVAAVDASAWSGIMYTRDGMSGGLSIDNFTGKARGEKTELLYEWGGDWGVNNTNTSVTVGEWNFVAMTVEAGTGGADGVVTIYSADPNSSTLAFDKRESNKYNAAAIYNSVWFGRDTAKRHAFKGYMRDMRLFDHALDATSLETLFNDEITGIIPAIEGLQATQIDNILSWSVTQDSGINFYTIIDIADGSEIAQIPADGGPYEYTLDPGVRVKLMITDNRGFITYFTPTNPAYSTLAYDLAPGWNLISFSGDEVDLTGLEAITTSPFYGWDGTSYVEIDTTLPEPIKAGDAFWAFSDLGGQLDIETKITTSTITLIPGWNMNGRTDQDPFTLPDSVYSIYIWNTTEKNYEHTNTVLKGLGYWFFSF